MDFLGSIELIHSKEKEYKKSEIFKKTSIPLMILYKEFYMWQKSQIKLFWFISGVYYWFWFWESI